MEQAGNIQYLILAGWFFMAAVIGRSICNVGFIERPLVIGFAWWICTGEYTPALPLALFFELFWLDLFHIGGYLPPMGAFPYLVLLALAHWFAWLTPTALAFPLAVTLPLAYLPPYVESRQRDYQKNASTKLLQQAQRNGPLGRIPSRWLTASVAQQLVLALLLFSLAIIVLLHGFSLEFMEKKASFIPLDVDWSILYAIAAVGAVLSLRILRAYIVFSLCMAALLISKLTS